MLRGKSLVWIIVMVSVISCNKEYNLEDIRMAKLEFESLQIPLRNEFMKNLIPRVSEGVAEIGWSKEVIVNLDSTYSSFDYKTTGLHGFYPGKIILIINDKRFYISAASKIGMKPPFILYQHSLFCVATANLSSKEDVREATYFIVHIEDEITGY